MATFWNILLSNGIRFNQTVDHFGFTTEAKFQQKYLYNDEWFVSCWTLKILILTNFDYLKYLSQWWPGGTSRVVQSFSTLATRGWSRLLLRTGWSAWHGQGFSSERYGVKDTIHYLRNYSLRSGFMWDIAPEFNALLVFAEHRYLTIIQQVLGTWLLFSIHG